MGIEVIEKSDLDPNFVGSNLAEIDGILRHPVNSYLLYISVDMLTEFRSEYLKDFHPRNVQYFVPYYVEFLYFHLNNVKMKIMLNSVDGRN